MAGRRQPGPPSCRPASRDRQWRGSAMSNRIVVDGDGHVLEPEDLWPRFLEPQWRGRAIRIARDAEGMENLLIDGKSHGLVRGKLGTLGGIGMQDDLEALFTPGAR